MFALHQIRRRIALAATVLGVLFMAAPTASAVEAHASNAASGPRTWYATAGVTTSTHAIEGMVFLPGAITIDAGDTIVWNAGSADIHTIVLPGAGGQIAPYDPTSYQPTSNTTYDGSTYTASPVLTVLPQAAGVPFTATSYRLTFTKAGTYTYLCTVHQGMRGTVVVQPAGTAYPHTQVYYDNLARAQRTQIIAQGWQLYGQALEKASSHQVIAGIGKDQVDVMRFVRQTDVIHAGQSVTFTNLSMGPHTVTFGAEIGNPALPWGDPTHFDGSYPLNSGFVGVTVPASFTVTFTKPGTYSYHCALHDYMGMVGTVIVLL
jgi:plastocyanin